MRNGTTPATAGFLLGFAGFAVMWSRQLYSFENNFRREAFAGKVPAFPRSFGRSGDELPGEQP
jgi:hypothetical protein